MNDGELLGELEPCARQLLNRHLGSTQEWFPHELVPWSRGRDFVAGQPWVPGSEISAAARSALFVNLLTEDNLPYYFRTIEGRFGRDDAWGEWARRWTAEEGRHSIVLRDYLTVSRALDPVVLERARMIQVARGVAPEPSTAAELLVYVSLQELATRIAHHNTGRLLDEVGRRIMTRVATDENLHHLFYRDVTAAALELDPEGMMGAIERQVRGFAMPGVGIPDFAQHARTIADAGVYDLATHHDQILMPVLVRQWRLDRIEGLRAAGNQARERLFAYLERTGRIARRLLDRRAQQIAAST